MPSRLEGYKNFKTELNEVIQSFCDKKGVQNFGLKKIRILMRISNFKFAKYTFLYPFSEVRLLNSEMEC